MSVPQESIGWTAWRPVIVILVLFDAIGACIKGAFVLPPDISYRNFVILSTIRSLTRRDRTHKLLPRHYSTLEVYKSFATSHNFQPDIISLDYGANGLWLSRSSTSSITSRNRNVLIYFHGGAYTSPARPEHLEVLLELVKHSHKSSTTSSVEPLAVLIVAYTLVPDGKYPVQLKQAVSALNYVIQDEEVPPSRILIAGDSAGGHLALSLLSHLSHPHPDSSIPRVAGDMSKGGAKLAGACLISPWVTFSTSSPSMKYNLHRDFLDPPSLTSAAKRFLDSDDIAVEDPYCNPLIALPEWWKGLRVECFCIIAGSFEIFLDDIIALSETVKMHNPGCEMIVAEKEVHVQMVFNRALQRCPAGSEDNFKAWLRRLLSQ